MRSRADILPSLCWRSRRSRPPPSCASWSRRFISCSFCSRFMGGDYKTCRRSLAVRPFDFAQGRLRTAVGWLLYFCLGRGAQWSLLTSRLAARDCRMRIFRLNGAFFPAHSHIDEGEVGALAFVLVVIPRINGHNVLIA